jgi:predicted RNase H-like HicB family nuclease
VVLIFIVMEAPWRLAKDSNMERIIQIHIEKLPEGVYLATSDDIQGLVAQGRTVNETLEIARDVARRLLQAQAERKEKPKLKAVKKSFDMQLVVGD